MKMTQADQKNIISGTTSYRETIRAYATTPIPMSQPREGNFACERTPTSLLATLVRATAPASSLALIRPTLSMPAPHDINGRARNGHERANRFHHP